MSARAVRPQSEHATRDTRSAIASAVERLVRATVGLPDEAMGRPWAWGVYDEEGLRFALLMTQHELRGIEEVARA